MANIPSDLNTTQQLPPNVNPQHQGILDQTLGGVLHSNPQAQNIVMKSMNLSQEQFQQLLGKTDNNQLMNMKVRDLFSSGVVQQALATQNQTNANATQLPPIPEDQIILTPEQAAQIQAQEQNGQPMQIQPNQQQPSLMQKLKGLLGL